MRKRRVHVARSAKPKAEEDTDHVRTQLRGADEAREESHGMAGILHLQKTIGNRATQQLIIQRQPSPGGDKPKGERSSHVLATMDVAGDKHDITLLSVALGGAGGGKESGEKVSVVLTKHVDEAGAVLRQAFLRGLSIKTARFEFFRRLDDGTVEPLHSLEFVEGMVTSYQVSGSDQPIEVVGVEFEGRG